MRMDKLTSTFQQALADAQSLAVKLNHGFIEPEHLLKALLEQNNGTANSVLMWHRSMACWSTAGRVLLVFLPVQCK